MKLGGNDLYGRITCGEDGCLAAGCRATVEQTRACANQQCHELRALVLNEHAAIAVGTRLRDVAAGNCASRSQQSTRTELDAIGLQLPSNVFASDAYRNRRNALIAQADDLG